MKVNLNEIVTIDFETYYDGKYSLRAKAYNTSSYIRDPQFLIHCCAIKIGTKKSKCYPRDEAIRILQGIDWTRHDLWLTTISSTARSRSGISGLNPGVDTALYR